MKSRAFPFRLSGRSLILVLAASLTALYFFPVAANIDSAESWLDQWVSQKGTTRIEVRPAPDGLYEVVIVWVSENADSRVKESLGKTLASGFAWDSRKGEFTGGTLIELKGSECRLVPENRETLDLIVKKGILSRTIPWKRLSAAL